MTDYINIYDFDRTVYNGNSSIDFFFFAMRKKPGLMRYLPAAIGHAVLYFLRQEDVGTFKGHFYHFVAAIPDLDSFIKEFWISHDHNIKMWFKDQSHDRDVIISASAEFLLQPIVDNLKVKALLATKVDLKTGKLIGPNCRGQEKVKRLQAALPGITIKAAYSDHKVDLPMLKLAEKQYMVKGNKVMPLDPNQLD